MQPVWMLRAAGGELYRFSVEFTETSVSINGALTSRPWGSLRGVGVKAINACHCLENVINCLGGARYPYPLIGDDKRALNQAWVCDHCVQQFLVAGVLRESQFLELCFLGAHGIDDVQAGRLD